MYVSVELRFFLSFTISYSYGVFRSDDAILIKEQCLNTLAMHFVRYIATSHHVIIKGREERRRGGGQLNKSGSRRKHKT